MPAGRPAGGSAQRPSLAETKSQRASGKHSDHAIVMTRSPPPVSHEYLSSDRIA